MLAPVAKFEPLMETAFPPPAQPAPGVTAATTGVFAIVTLPEIIELAGMPSELPSLKSNKDGEITPVDPSGPIALNVNVARE